MRKVNFRTKAREDLSEIWDYTLSQWTEEQADNYYMDLVNQCSKLAISPELGRA